MRNRQSPKLLTAALGLLVVGSAGCNGQVDGTPKTPPPDGTGGTPGAGAGGSGAGASSGGAIPPVAIVTSGTPPADSAGPLMMRRLTYREYDHMLADLVGDTTAPAEGGNAWSPDPPNVVGYVAPTSVADLLVDLYNQTADAIVDTALQATAAGKAAGKFSIPCKSPSGTAAETTCATQFITTFGLQVFRRPVSAAEQTDLLTLFSKVRQLGLEFTGALGAVAKGMLQSPNFLYHWEIGPTRPVVGADGLIPLTPWQLAARMASLLWESVPDATLLQAAQSGALSTPAQVATQASRMLTDQRAASGLFNFHAQWLFSFGSQGRDLTQPLSKSSPLYTDAVAAGLQTEFADFIAAVYTGDATLAALFTAPYTYANRDIAAIYGAQGPSTGFAKVMLDPTKRAGIFTQTAFLATLANDATDNPVYRGLSIYLKVLCGKVGSPPPNVPPVTFLMNGTTRQSYDAHGMADCANGCHSRFDPPGFAFENYDGMGSFRTTEAGQAVDATGSFKTPAGATLAFRNAVDLAKQLGDSAEAQACIDRQWTRYLLGRPETPAEAGAMSVAYQKAAATKGFSLQDLLKTLMQSKAFMYRQASPGEAL